MKNCCARKNLLSTVIKKPAKELGLTALIKISSKKTYQKVIATILYNKNHFIRSKNKKKQYYYINNKYQFFDNVKIAI